MDSRRAPFVRKAFELYATGERPVRDVRDYLRAAGALGRRGKNPLSSSQCHVMLRNPIYYGVLRYKGELYEGRHAPIISKALFDKCQEMFRNKSKPRSTGLKPFIYRGAFRCAACGCFITTETQKSRNYLRCTRKKGACSEPFVREKEIDRQVREELGRLALPPELVAEALLNIKSEGAKAARAGTEAARELRAELAVLNGRTDKLVDLLLQGAIAHRSRNCWNYAVASSQLPWSGVGSGKRCWSISPVIQRIPFKLRAVSYRKFVGNLTAIRGRLLAGQFRPPASHLTYCFTYALLIGRGISLCHMILNSFLLSTCSGS